MVVVGLLLLATVYGWHKSKDEIESIELIIDSNVASGPLDNSLLFWVYASKGTPFSDVEGVEGQYSLVYEGKLVKTAGFSFNSSDSARVKLPLTSFYRDNGPYTLRVNVQGLLASESFNVTRTVHGLTPELVLTDPDTFRVGLGLRPTAEPDEEAIVATTGEGAIEFYFVAEGEDETLKSNWRRVERLSYRVDLDRVDWELESDGSYGVGLIEFDKAYLQQAENGSYAAQVDFNNSYARRAADNPQVEGLSPWVYLKGED